MRRRGVAAAGFLVAGVAAVGWTAAPASSQAAEMQTLVFNKTSTFTVPVDVQCATFLVTGAVGGDGAAASSVVPQRTVLQAADQPGGAGGIGGQVRFTTAVAAGDTYGVYVGLG